MLVTLERPSTDLERQIAGFRDEILNNPVGVIDPPTQHQEFKSGMHGRKLDFDKILPGTKLYDQWVDTYYSWIAEMYALRLPNVLVGVANGTNQLAYDMSIILCTNYVETLKDDDGGVMLAENSKRALSDDLTSRVLVVEDVGTTGGTTAGVVRQIGGLGISDISVCHTWIRTESLPKLDEMDIEYSTMIHEELPTFTPDDCMTMPQGFCRQGVLLIPR